MAANEAEILISELDGDCEGRSPERWSELLRQVARLFVADAHRFSDAQIALFDDIFCRLSRGADVSALIFVSERLADLDNAPRKVVRQLAFHQDISVADAVLRKSSLLEDSHLCGIAKRSSSQHLLKVAERRSISVAVSDKLVERGDTPVLITLLQNPGVRFSKEAYTLLFGHASRNDELAELLARKSDMPATLRRQATPKSGSSSLSTTIWDRW